MMDSWYQNCFWKSRTYAPILTFFSVIRRSTPNSCGNLRCSFSLGMTNQAKVSFLFFAFSAFFIKFWTWSPFRPCQWALIFIPTISTVTILSHYPITIQSQSHSESSHFIPTFPFFIPIIIISIPLFVQHPTLCALISLFPFFIPIIVHHPTLCALISLFPLLVSHYYCSRIVPITDHALSCLDRTAVFAGSDTSWPSRFWT